MKTKFTLGPWKVYKGNDRIYAPDNLGDQSGPVAEALHRYDPLERVANKRLIAAAPELLAMVKEAVGAWTHGAPIGPRSLIVGRARAIIAKATGAADDEDGTSGQDRESYSDDQDRDNYT